MQGVDLGPVVADPATEVRDHVLFAHATAHTKNIRATRWAIRGVFDGRHKYARYYGVGGGLPNDEFTGVPTPMLYGPDAAFEDQEHEWYDQQEDPHELLVAGGVFAVSIVARDDRAIVRKFTKPVEHDADARTLNGFPYRNAVTGAPVLEQAVAYLDCEVRQHLDLGGHTLFVGEVVDAAINRADATPASMRDTRMKYGGTRRGH